MTNPLTKHLEGDLLEQLDEVLEYLDDHMDVKDGSYGVPTPNRAMQLHTDLSRTVERFRRTIDAATKHTQIESTDERKIERIIRVLKAAKPAVSAKMDHKALAAGILYAIQEQP